VGDQVVEEVGAADGVDVLIRLGTQLVLDLAPDVVALLLDHPGCRARVVEVEFDLGVRRDPEPRYDVSEKRCCPEAKNRAGVDASMSELTCSRVISRRMYERSGARGSNRLARRVWPLTQNLSSADRQISASTIGQYRAMATSYRQGTWSHDVSQNIQALLAAVAGPTPYRILDLGCGPGRDLVTFRDLGHVVVGLDGCPEFVAMARAVSGCEVLQQDMLAMTLPRASFDAVFANAVLFHVPSLGLPVVLDRLHAALKPGGVLLASNPRGQDEEGFVDGRYACFVSAVVRPHGWLGRKPKA
jgi:SAM-dependent methyltransferase